MKFFFLIFSGLQLFISHFLFGQSWPNKKGYPEIGMKCPDFKLSDIRYYKLNQATLRDFEGKWLILDFWSKGCSGCIAQFPKLDSINKKFKDELQVILIGQNTNRYNRDIDVLFEKVKVKQQINLPIAYDSILFEQFGIMGVPGVVIIDPEGVVKAVTYSITPEKVSDLLNGKPVYFEYKPNLHEANEIDSINKNTLRPGKMIEEILSGSYISKWEHKTQKRSIVLSIENNLKEGYFSVTGASLIDLYKYAYIGRYSWWNDDSLNFTMSQHPLFELSDPGPFDINFDTGKGGYNYYLRTPVEIASVSYFQQVMKRDLKQFFGYEISFESRDVLCYRLTASEDAKRKLATKNGQRKYHHDFASLQLINVPVKSLVSYIQSNTVQDYPIIDNTGIASNIDISLEVMLTDLNDVKRELGRYGLKLEKGTTKMTMMVFRNGK